MCRFDEIIQLLIALVTNGEPTPSNYYMHDVDTPNGAFRVNKWLMHGETRYSPLVDFVGRCIIVASKRTLKYFLGLILWMLSIGRPAIPALVIPLALLVVVLSSSMLVGSFQEVIWRWSLKPIS